MKIKIALKLRSKERSILNSINTSSIIPQRFEQYSPTNMGSESKFLSEQRS
jgi:hypothetical protein